MLTVVEKVIFLQNVDVFSHVPTEQLAYLAAVAEEVEFSEGDDIFKENDPSDSLYLVLDGRVRLHKSDTEIEVAKAKRAFGTWALFDEVRRVVTATALDDTRLLRIDREDFADLLADHQQITQGILKTLASRFRELMEHVKTGTNRPG